MNCLITRLVDAVREAFVTLVEEVADDVLRKAVEDQDYKVISME